MKNILFIIVSLMILCVSCNEESKQIFTNSVEHAPVTSRIQVIAKYVSTVQPCIYIYKIDGCEYVAHEDGGIIHLETCPNHKDSTIQDFSGINSNGDSDLGI